MGTINTNNKNFVVYKHTTPNGKVYIGITCRKPNYRYGKDGKNYIGCPLFWNAIQKFGWNNITHEILSSGLSKAEAERMEIELIIHYKSNNQDYGYNLDNGGHSCGMHSEITRQKMSNSHIGKHHSEETIAKISRANSGKKRSEEMKAQYRKAHQGKVLSEEHKKHIGISCSGENNGMYGKHHNEDTKAKIGIAVSGKNSGKAKRVLCIETNQIFDTATQAGQYYEVHRTSISQCCLGKVKTIKGKHFIYLSEE